MKRADPPCPCGTGKRYAECCAPLHEGSPAPTAEALMRSRYSAYALRLDTYLLATWHPTTRPVRLDLGENEAKWIGLNVRGHVADGDRASVEFVARYRLQGRGQRLHERSRFVHEAGRWYYVDGDMLD